MTVKIYSGWGGPVTGDGESRTEQEPEDRNGAERQGDLADSSEAGKLADASKVKDAIAQGYQIWGNKAYEDLQKTTELRRQAIRRLDRIENFILSLVTFFAIASVALAVLGISLDSKTPGLDARYLTGGLASGLLAFVLNLIKSDFRQRRLYHMDEEKKYQNCLQLLQAASLVEDSEVRASLISNFAAALTEEIRPNRGNSSLRQSRFSRRGGQQRRRSSGG